MVIRTLRYVDVSDLSEAAQEAYHEFATDCGIHPNQHRLWKVGENDSTPASWIGQEKCNLIDDALRNEGFKDGEEISLTW